MTEQQAGSPARCIDCRVWATRPNPQTPWVIIHKDDCPNRQERNHG